MWESKIVDKGLEKDRIVVNVSYSDGTREFNELYRVTSLKDLDNQIRTKKNSLTTLQTSFTEIPTGTYVPPVPTLSIEDQKLDMVRQLTEMKNLISVGIKKDTDADYLALIASYKLL